MIDIRVVKICRNCGERVNDFIEDVEPDMFRTKGQLQYLSECTNLHNCRDGNIGVYEIVRFEKVDANDLFT